MPHVASRLRLGASAMSLLLREMLSSGPAGLLSSEGSCHEEGAA